LFGILSQRVLTQFSNSLDQHFRMLLQLRNDLIRGTSFPEELSGPDSINQDDPFRNRLTFKGFYNALEMEVH